MNTVAYWQHDRSGEFYAVQLDETGAVIGLCGPLYYDDVTTANLETPAFDFDNDPEEIAWASSAPLRPRRDGFPGDVIGRNEGTER